MNVDRCVELHNKIVRHGWSGSGRALDALPRETFDVDIENASSLRHLLSPDLVAFLEQAWFGGDDQAFFYYVAGLNPPCSLFRNREISNDEQEGRYVNLYGAENIASHPDGLIFDQMTNTAIMQMSIWDEAAALNGRQKWVPLETILEAWLDMIEVGKVKAVPEDVEALGEKYHPWISLPYSDQMLVETVDIFNDLVEAIESRMPHTHHQPQRIGLVDYNVLGDSNIPPGFAYEFIKRVRRPRFRFIAPGLSVPSSSNLTDQALFTIPNGVRHNRLHTEIPPILLFRSTLNFIKPADSSNSGAELPFGYSYTAFKRYPAGLYFDTIDRGCAESNFEDACKLVLPFGIGENAYARKSDGSRFGENTEQREVRAKNTFADLYQPGYNPFIGRYAHEVRLVSVLKSWLGMIERGDWKVDGEGVVGGMGEWKRADTEADWEKFVVPVHW